MVSFTIDNIDSNSYSIPVQDHFLEQFLSIFSINYKTQDQSTIIIAKSVMLLSDFLLKFNNGLVTYDYAYGFSQNIVQQLLYLEKQSKTIHAFSIDDFLVIDESFLIFVNFSKIHNIKNNNIIIHSPYHKNNSTFFITQEMKNNNSLPLTLSCKNIYVSLAFLILYLLYGKYYYDFENNEKLTNNLQGTKLYYFLRNCINNDNSGVCFF
jgi:hypothetical protein